MKPIRSIVLVDDGAGADVTPAILAQIAAACQLQIYQDFSPFWGNPGVTVVEGPAPAAGDPSVPVYVRASSDVAGAAGYHDDQGIFVFRDGLPGLTSGPFSLSVVISHEIIETLGDPGANRFADAGGGVEYAIELCDAVESSCYEVGGVSVSAFLLPSWFDPEGSAPFAFGAAPRKPFTLDPAGYQIVRQVTAAATQVSALHAPRPERLAAKRHPSSRTSRRGCAL